MLLLVQPLAPVLGWRHYLVAGYLGTSEAEGELSLFQLLGSVAQFGGGMAQRSQLASS